MRIFNGFEELKAAVGTVVGVSDWIEVTQDRINKFAEATCDEQWIHVFPTSSMLTRLRDGACDCALSINSSNSGMPDAARVASGPGEMAWTRMPFGPSSAAM